MGFHRLPAPVDPVYERDLRFQCGARHRAFLLKAELDCLRVSRQALVRLVEKQLETPDGEERPRQFDAGIDVVAALSDRLLEARRQGASQSQLLTQEDLVFHKRGQMEGVRRVRIQRRSIAVAGIGLVIAGSVIAPKPDTPGRVFAGCLRRSSSAESISAHPFLEFLAARVDSRERGRGHAHVRQELRFLTSLPSLRNGCNSSMIRA